MPGPISDSYDPEFGTAGNVAQINDALRTMYLRLTGILGGVPPRLIVDLVRDELPTPIAATLTEKEWRLLRFAIERARESL